MPDAALREAEWHLRASMAFDQMLFDKLDAIDGHGCIYIEDGSSPSAPYSAHCVCQEWKSGPMAQKRKSKRLRTAHGARGLVGDYSL